MSGGWCGLVRPFALGFFSGISRVWFAGMGRCVFSVDGFQMRLLAVVFHILCGFFCGAHHGRVFLSLVSIASDFVFCGVSQVSAPVSVKRVPWVPVPVEWQASGTFGRNWCWNLGLGCGLLEFRVGTFCFLLQRSVL